MEMQDKLLDIEYLQERVNNLSVIRSKEMNVSIHKSNRATSRTLYIEFWKDNEGHIFKLSVIRVSDHSLDIDTPQLIVRPNEYLTKSKKQQFAKMLENAVRVARTKSLYHNLTKMA